MTEVVEIILTVLPWVISVALLILAFYLKYKRLPETIAEWKQALENVVSVRDKIIKFFNQEVPMSETPIEIINEYIPANTYQMSDASQALVLSYCDSEEEKQRVLAEIYNWENPTKTGEECCIYTLETSRATFCVQYGVPELVSIKEKKVYHLTQMQCSEIVNLLSKNEPFATMWTIMKNESAGVNEYEISDGVSLIKVCNGEYSLFADLD